MIVSVDNQIGLFLITITYLFYRSRRKLPLSEINGNSKSQRKTKAVALPVEKDERKLSTRQRQIDIGKNTVGYKLYTEDCMK